MESRRSKACRQRTPHKIALMLAITSYRPRYKNMREKNGTRGPVYGCELWKMLWKCANSHYFLLKVHLNTRSGMKFHRGLHASAHGSGLRINE